MKRIIIFATVSAILWTAESLWLSARQPEISKALALQQVNGVRAAVDLLQCKCLGDFRLASAEPKTFRCPEDSRHCCENNNTFHTQSPFVTVSACDDDVVPAQSSSAPVVLNGRSDGIRPSKTLEDRPSNCLRG